MSKLPQRPDVKVQIDAIKTAVCSAVSGVKPHPFGHAFLWGTVEVKLKNGASRFFRQVLGSVCAEDLSECVRLAESVPGVSAVTYVMD